MTFKTDGEMYDASLTRKTKSQAKNLKEKIEMRIRLFGYIRIFMIVCSFNGFPEPRNAEYAAYHGWTKEDMQKFEIRKNIDGTFGVYLGTPRFIGPYI